MGTTIKIDEGYNYMSPSYTSIEGIEMIAIGYKWDFIYKAP